MAKGLEIEGIEVVTGGIVVILVKSVGEILVVGGGVSSDVC